MRRLAPSPRARSWLATGGRVAAIAGVAAGLYFFLRGIDLGALGNAVARAALAPLALACALGLGVLLGKALFWKLMVAPAAKVPLLRMWRYNVLSYATSLVTPARAGEILRFWLLKRREGVPAGFSAAVLVAEKLGDTLALLVLVAPIPLLLPGLPTWVSRSVLVLLVAGCVGALALWATLRRAHPERRLGKLVAGMAVLRRPHGLAAAVGACLIAWCIDLLNIWVVLQALGIRLPWAASMLILLTVNLAILVPTTPGHLGALELGAVVATDLLGVPRADGLAFALVYHGVQIVPLLLAGAANLKLALEAQRQMGAEVEQVEQVPATD
jgi:glycosyltransferase 2 family protein